MSPWKNGQREAMSQALEVEKCTTNQETDIVFPAGKVKEIDLS